MQNENSPLFEQCAHIVRDHAKLVYGIDVLPAKPVTLDQRIADYKAAQLQKIAVILSREEIATIRAALNVAEKDAGDKFGKLWDRFNDIYSSMVSE